MSKSRYKMSKFLTHLSIESIKKEPVGSDFNRSSCLKWWRLGDSNS